MNPPRSAPGWRRVRAAVLGLALGLALLAALVAAMAQLGVFAGRVPTDLGVNEGRLKPPSATPNSVHSQAARWPGHPQQAYAQIDPLPLRGDGPSTMARLRTVVAAMPGATLVTVRDDYLHASFRTRWMGFVDDAEFWLDPAAGVVQLRSAARLGRRDFGVNRDRVEVIRAALAAAG